MSVATALDAETTSFYSLEITATDRHSTQPLSRTAKVSVKVTGKLVENELMKLRDGSSQVQIVFLSILSEWCSARDPHCTKRSSVLFRGIITTFYRSLFVQNCFGKALIVSVICHQ